MFRLGADFRPALWFASLLGFALGPLSYQSGEMFQVLKFLSPLAFWIYAAFWALAFPLVLALSRSFSRRPK